MRRKFFDLMIPQNQKLLSMLGCARKIRETGLFANLSAENLAEYHLGVLRVTGSDAASFLHSQLTNEVKNLMPGQGNLSARITRTGTLLSYFSLHRLPEPEAGFLLILERDAIAELQQDLEKFTIAEDVQFSDISNHYDILALQGPHASTFSESFFGKLGLDKNESWANLPEYATRFMGAEVRVVSRSLTGDTGFLVLVEKSSGIFAGLMKQLAAAAESKNWLFLEDAALREVLTILRIEAGWVKIGLDVASGERVLPETGLENQLVSYSKGCYLGQEVIARIRTYGSLPHVLRGLVFETSETSVGERADALSLMDKFPLIHSGTKALVELMDGVKIGTWASSTFSVVLDAPIALAYLDRTHRTPGTVLSVKLKDGFVAKARVHLLPFYKASDLKSRVDFLHDRAIRLFSDEKDEQAIELLEQALKLDPTFSEGYEALGVILGRSGRFAEAIEIFKRLEEIAPEEPMVHSNLSLYYMKMGDKEKAEEQKSLATVKQFSRFGTMAKTHEKLAQESAAKRTDALRKKAMFEEVLTIDAEDPIALFGLGNVYSTLEQWRDAEAMLGRACRVQKDNSAAYLAHGKTLEMLDRNAEALSVYQIGMTVASKKGDLMPLKEMERRSLLLGHQ